MTANVRPVENAMRRRWTRTDMHLLGARTVFLIAIISIPSFIAWWLIAPSRADIAMEDRLLGKWEVRLAGSIAYRLGTTVRPSVKMSFNDEN